MKLGPGAIVAAAFIGPGTVTTAAVAGSTLGVSLWWAVVLSLGVTLLLQALVVRLTCHTGYSLARNIGARSQESTLWRALAVLVAIAIGVGNAAYQSGNISGAVLGLGGLAEIPQVHTVIVLSLLAATLIIINRYHWLERVLVWLVALMAVVFVSLALWLSPLWLRGDWWMWDGSSSSMTLVLALVGTTIVPYNLFLHSQAVLERYGNGAGVATAALRESVVSISIGGLVTLAILLVSAAVSMDSATPTGDSPILPLLGKSLGARLPGSEWLLSLGLFAAGLTSAIAAPVAAGWTLCGLAGRDPRTHPALFKGVALVVLGAGCVFAALASRPEALIVTAQVANALLLPCIALVLVLLSLTLLPKGKRWLLIAPSGFALVVLLILAGYRLVRVLGA